MRVSAMELQYVGGDHWAAILDGIADLKDHFERDEQLTLVDTSNLIEDSSCRDSIARPQLLHALLLYGCSPTASRAEILSTLLPRAAVDRYIFRYFNYLYLVAYRCALFYSVIS